MPLESNDDTEVYHYQAGYLNDISPSDPEFATLDEAMAWAMSHRGIMAIWTSQVDGGELLHIIYEGEVFSK
jgi:hypothetical protein